MATVFNRSRSPEYLAESTGPRVLGVSCIVFELAVIAVILRFVSRSISKTKLGYDDLFIVLALVRPFSRHRQIMLTLQDWACLFSHERMLWYRKPKMLHYWRYSWRGSSRHFQGVAHGADRHFEVFDFRNLQKLMITLFVAQVSYPFPMILIKCSILAFYRRIFNPVLYSSTHEHFVCRVGHMAGYWTRSSSHILYQTRVFYVQ